MQLAKAWRVRQPLRAQFDDHRGNQKLANDHEQQHADNNERAPVDGPEAQPIKSQQQSTTTQTKVTGDSEQTAGDAAGQRPVIQFSKEQGCHNKTRHPQRPDPQGKEDAFKSGEQFSGQRKYFRGCDPLLWILFGAIYTGLR